MLDDHHYIGQMDRFVDVVQKQKTLTDTGSRTVSDVFVKSVFAKRTTKGGSEDVDGKIIDIENVSYIVHFDNDLFILEIDELFLADSGRNYKILAVDEIGRNYLLELKCERRD